MTVLIKNARLLVSDLESEEKADVFISGGNISAIGSFPNKNADAVIDARGGYLSPGFIDVGASSDHYLSLFSNPGQGDFLRQGVTTIIGGHCGASLAPLLYGNLESVRKWGDPGRVNVDWHTTAEFLERVESLSLGVNFATFTGHSTIRRALIGDDVRDLSANEVAVFESVLRRALEEGAVGLSTGLEYVHARGTPYKEILALAQAARESKGIYSTHLRDTGPGLSKALKEALRIHKETEISVLVTHFMPYLGFEDEYHRAIELLDSLPPEADFHIGMHSMGGSLVPFYRLLPQWAQTGAIEIMSGSVRDPWMAKRIIKELPQFVGRDLIIAEAPGRNVLVGESLGDFMDMYEMKDPQEGLLSLLALTGLKGVAYVQNVNRELADATLAHSRTLITSHASPASSSSDEKIFNSPRSTNTFPEYLRRVTEGGLLTLPEAVRKITALPATKFNLTDRGKLREGYVADLAILSSDLKIKSTLVNGEVAFLDGELTGNRRGRPLRHQI